MSCFPCTGSDVTVQLDTAELSLLFQLPFGSHTRTFLQEVARACPGRWDPRLPVTAGGGSGWALTSPPPVDFAHFELILHSFCALLKLLAWGHSAPRPPAGHGVCISVFPFLDQSFNSSRAPLPSLLWAGLNGVRCDSNTESSVN